jgi:hypothetical protein
MTNKPNKDQVLNGLLMEIGRVEMQREEAVTKSRMNKSVTEIVMINYQSRIDIIRRAIELLEGQA